MLVLRSVITLKRSAFSNKSYLFINAFVCDDIVKYNMQYIST